MIFVEVHDFHGKFMISMQMMIVQEMAPQKPRYSYRNTMVSRTGGEKDQIFMRNMKVSMSLVFSVGAAYVLYFFVVFVQI